MPIELNHDHVAIRAVDYAGTIAWYQDKLDFTVDQEWPFGDMQLDVDATLAELRSRGVEVLGDAIDLNAIDRRLGFFKDNNNNNVIELASPL